MLFMIQLHLQQEVSFVSAALQEERFRVERLEEQINDLTELHQNEVKLQNYKKISLFVTCK